MQNTYCITNDTILQADQINNAERQFCLIDRGCIAQCSYCSGRELRNIYLRENLPVQRIRKRGFAHLFKELLLVKEKTGKDTVRKITFTDEYFVRPAPLLVEFFNEYREKINLPFYLRLHANQIADHPEVLEAAFDAGLEMCSFGVQSGSEDFCKKVYHRNNDNEKILKAIHDTVEKGIRTQVYFIAGNPLETEEVTEATNAFIKRMPVPHPSFQPYAWLVVTRLSVADGTPLAKEHPTLQSRLPSGPEFYRQAMLMHFRLFLDDDAYREVAADTLLLQQPHLLSLRFHAMLHNRHYAYREKEIQRLDGKPVYFWGFGRTYRQTRHLFQNTRPQAIVIDSRENAPATIDGLNVIPPEALHTLEPAPLVLFDEFYNLRHTIRNLRQFYPQYADIVTSTYFYE